MKAGISASQSTRGGDHTMKPEVLLAMGCDRMSFGRKEMRADSDRDPAEQGYPAGTLTDPRTMIQSKRLADVHHGFVLFRRSEVNSQYRRDHFDQLQRREILGVGRDALDRRGDQDDAPPEVPGEPSLAHDHAPLSMSSTKRSPKAIRIIESYRQNRRQTPPNLE
jgi:hypothetical protein